MAKLLSARNFSISFFLLAILGFSVQAIPDDKPTPATVISKHLESIGSDETRTNLHGTKITGDCLLTVREGGAGQAQGTIELASQGEQNQLRLNFGEGLNPIWFKFDGSKTTVSQFRPGSQTSLEKFFADYQIIIKEGLFGGVLSESWPLLRIETKNPKLEYGGTREINGQRLAVLKYTPRQRSDLKIVLLFEPTTFRHVRTEYSHTIYVTDQQRIPGGRGELPSPGSQRASNARIKAFEEFSEFREEHGLVLPHSYTFELAIQSDRNPALVNWAVNLSNFDFSTPLSETN